jgi:hypothetical protein
MVSTRHTRCNANERSAIGADVVLVGAELATLSRDTLELLLSRRVGIADVHGKSLGTETSTVELANDLVADLACLETVLRVRCWCSNIVKSQSDLPGKPNPTTVSHTVTENLAGENGISHEDMTEILESVRRRVEEQRGARAITFSFRDLGRLEM